MRLAAKFQAQGDEFHRFSLFFSKQQDEVKSVVTGMLSKVCYGLARTTLGKTQDDLKLEIKKVIEKEIQNLQKLLKELEEES